MLARFDFAPTNSGVFLPVSVEGREYLFLLDTGTSLMVYDESFRRLLGPPAGREPTEGAFDHRQTNDLFQAPEATLGKMSLRTPEPVLCDDLSAARRLSGVRFFGVIGMSFLRRHSVYLDCANHQLLFVRTHEQGAGAAVLDRIPSPPYTSIMLPNGKEQVMLDSGTYNFGALAPARFDALATLNKITVVATNWVAAFGAQRIVTTGRLEGFGFSGKSFSGAVFERSAPSRLGWGFLTNYNWLLDFPHDRIIAEPL